MRLLWTVMSARRISQMYLRQAALRYPKDPNTPPDALGGSPAPPPTGEIVLRQKEIDAGEGGYTVVVRPRKPKGGFWVMQVRISDQKIVSNPLIAETKADVPRAITEILRDMNKFQGVGGNLAWRGRRRDKRVASFPSTLKELPQASVGIWSQVERLLERLSRIQGLDQDQEMVVGQMQRALEKWKSRTREESMRMEKVRNEFWSDHIDFTDDLLQGLLRILKRMQSYRVPVDFQAFVDSIANMRRHLDSVVL